MNLCPFLMLIVASVCFFLIILKTCHGVQTDTTCHYWPLVFWPQPITLHPDHALPSELHFPSLNQQSPFQMTVRLCVSLMLLASPSSTQPHFSLIDCFLSQSQTWELSTLTTHLSSTCPGQKPSSHFIHFPVLCWLSIRSLQTQFIFTFAWFPEWDHISSSEWTPRSKSTSSLLNYLITLPLIFISIPVYIKRFVFLFFFFNIHGCFACVLICVPHTCNVKGSQKRSLDSLELEL